MEQKWPFLIYLFVYLIGILPRSQEYPLMRRQLALRREYATKSTGKPMAHATNNFKGRKVDDAKSCGSDKLTGHKYYLLSIPCHLMFWL